MTISRFQNSRLRNFLLQVQDFWFSRCRQTATETTTKITQAHQTFKKKAPTPFPHTDKKAWSRIQERCWSSWALLVTIWRRRRRATACLCCDDNFSTPLVSDSWNTTTMLITSCTVAVTESLTPCAGTVQLVPTAGFKQLKHNHYVDHIKQTC